MALLAGVLVGQPVGPARAADAPSRAQPDRSVPVTDWRALPVAAAPMESFKAPSVAWPRAASREVALPSDARGRRQAVTAEVGGLPVTVSPAMPGGKGAAGAGTAAPATAPARVRVEVLDRDAVGALPQAAAALRVSRADGLTGPASVRLEVDYSRLRGAYGGDWASRLRLARVPDCALAANKDGSGDTGGSKEGSAQGSGCAGLTWLPSENSTDAGTLSAQVPLSGEVLALVAGPTGESGDFTKSDLKASYSWAHGGSSGDFTWSYPMEVPDVPGGLVPEVGLGYSSGAVDGQTAGQNVQPSWVGEGWNYSPPYIERTFRPCFDDRETDRHWNFLDNNPPLCWHSRNAQLFFGGKATQIILGSDGRWHLTDDDGERVTLFVGGEENGDNNGERWRIITPDGTQYWFGRYVLPNGRGITNSVATNLVFANHSSDQCFSTTWDDSHCFQAYRWMLDYVVDPHGNEISYFYNKEINQTSVRVEGGNIIWTYMYTYARSLRLSRIDYGTRVGDDPSRPAPARVSFGAADRCLQDCYLDTGAPRVANWPDTPWDLDCKTLSECSSNSRAVFYTTKRLARISTQVWDGSAYRVVDRWDLTHQFPATGNSTSPVLWLASIRRVAFGTGSVGIVMPPVTFHGVRMANRAFVDPAGSTAPAKYRLAGIHTDTGGRIEVAYSPPAPDCLAGQTPPAPNSNHRRCFPRGTGSGQTWWHKYLLTRVVERDTVAGSPDVVHSYGYSSTGSSTSVKWAHEAGAAVWGMSLGHRTWSSWRGWARVTVRTGPTSGPRTQTDYLYFRGLHGDRASTSGGTRSVQVDDDIFGSTFTDNLWRAGQVLQVRTFDVSGGTPVELTRFKPTQVRTGTQTVPSVSPSVFRSYIARTSQERSWDWNRATGSWAIRDYVDYTRDDLGRTTAAHDQRRATCTRLTYAGSTASWLTEFVSEEQVARGTCAEVPAIPADLLSDTRYYYDGRAHGAAPADGNLTKTEVYGDDGWFVDSQAGYDAYGRETSGSDALGRATTTAYTHNAAGLLTGVKVTNPAGHVTTTAIEPGRGSTLSVTDPNGKTTTAAYDPAGRLTKVWAPGRPTTATPNAEYAYSITKTAPSRVSTKLLGPNGNQIPSHELYDGLLRLRQVQETAPDGKRVITDTAYNDRGLTAKTSTFYNDASGPTTTLVTFADAEVDRQDRYTYDGQDRQTAVQRWSRGQLRHQTTTQYGFRTVTDIPPAGGTATTEVTDDRGNVVALRQHHARSVTAPYDESTFRYDPLDRRTAVTDPAGNRWAYAYDLAGRQISTSDPDAGTSTMAYDNAGQLTRTTDARGVALAYTYDQLGRQTSLREGSAAGPKRAEWTYDTLALGQLTASTRFQDGLAYTTAVTGYDHEYRPLGTRVTIPASPANGALAGSYTKLMSYHPDGSLAAETLPAVGGLPQETITYSYTDQGLPATTTGLAAYVSGTSHRWDGAVAELIHGAAGRRMRQSWAFEEATGRTLAAQMDAEDLTRPGVFINRFTTQYGYDDAGNVRAVAGKTGGMRDQVECFRYDHLARLVEAWTVSNWNCSDGAKRTGADPYHRTWTFDVAGNRLTQTDHDPAGDTAWSYKVGAAHGARPHQVAAVTATGPKAGTGQQSYAYDPAGNMTQHTTEAGDTRTLAWDAEGQLASVTAEGQETSYVYDADGARLLAREPASTTLYLGATEVRQAAGGAVTAVRYYDGVAVRTSAGLFWAGEDRNGTPVVQTDADTLDADRRRLLPFGEPRGEQPAWVGSKGYVGGTVDGTGFTQLGARGYDPGLGRFTSVDPVMDMADVTQWHGYAYANNSPVTLSDPTGLRACIDVCGGPADVRARQAHNARHKSGGGISGSGKSAPKSHTTSSKKRPPKHKKGASTGGFSSVKKKPRSGRLGARIGGFSSVKKKPASGRHGARIGGFSSLKKPASGRNGARKLASGSSKNGGALVKTGRGSSAPPSRSHLAAGPALSRWCTGIPFLQCDMEDFEDARKGFGDFFGDVGEYFNDLRELEAILIIAAIDAYCNYVDPVVSGPVVGLGSSIILALVKSVLAGALVGIALELVAVFCTGVRGESLPSLPVPGG